jgi:hypothetical protein
VSIQCQVRRRSDGLDGFAVDLRLRRQMVADFRLTGVVQQGAENVVAISLTMADAGMLSADCSADASVIVPGAVWLRAVTCREPLLGKEPWAACVFAGAAIFEDCGR